MLWKTVGHDIYIFGGGPAADAPWTAPNVEALVCTCQEFWNEVAPIPLEAQTLAAKYGVDPAAPLQSWLTDDDRSRLEEAAAKVGANPALLAPLRPWLAAQLLKMALETQAGSVHEHSAEEVLAARARDCGIPVHSEFPTADAVFGMFAGFPRDAEVEYLRFTLDDVEDGPETFLRDARATSGGDLTAIETKAASMRERYPALHNELAVARNRAWVPRIQAMAAASTRAFIVVGAGHMVGADSVRELLAEAGLPVEPADLR
jgi:hypothetical protein